MLDILVILITRAKFLEVGVRSGTIVKTEVVGVAVDCVDFVLQQ